MRSREVRLTRRPEGIPELDAFELTTVDVPDPGPGEVRVRNRLFSVDPWMLRAMREALPAGSPAQASKFGSAILDAPLYANALGEVVDSNDPARKPGDLVLSLEGWREGYTAPASALEWIEPGTLPLEAYLGAAGLTGLVAYAGLDVIGVGEGDVLFVSAAAGAVGTIACQIARIRGARVIGSAGGAEKAAFLREIGCDAAMDYKAESDLTAALAREAPDGITAFFDNVGSTHLAAAINNARPHGRILIAGLIASMSGASQPVPADLMVVVRQRLSIHGFSAGDHFGLMPKLREDMAKWIADGQLDPRVTVYEGIERAPEAFVGMLTGANIGKMLVRLP